MSDLPDMGLSVAHGVPRQLVDDFLESAVVRDADVRGEVRDPEGAYAGMEWLLPPSVVLFISGKYFGKLMELAAEDHYPLFVAAVRRLFDQSKLIQLVGVASSPKKLSAEPPGAFAVSLRFNSRRLLQFRFPAAQDEADLAFVALFDLLETVGMEQLEHELRLAVERGASLWSIVARFDASHSRWYLANPETNVAWLGGVARGSS